MSQKQAFLNGEGDQWWDRNKDKVKYPPSDPVIRAVKMLPKPDSILEIGCANGGRLNELQKLTCAEYIGIDPSQKAIKQGWQFSDVELYIGTADNLPFDRSFDIVIFGFCLYLVDRECLFKVVSEADRVLADGGHLIIYDFAPETPCSTPYEHLDGVTSYKMDYSRLFTANPAYREKSCWTADEEEGTSVSIIQKNLAGGYN